MPESQPAGGGRRKRAVPIVLIAILALVLLSAGTAFGAAIYRYRAGGPLTAVRTAVTVNDRYYSLGTELIAVPGAAVTMRVPTGERAIFIITFSAVVQCSGPQGGICYWSAFVDNGQAPPGKVQVATTDADNPAQSQTFQWVTGPLGPGDHAVTMAGASTANTTLYLLARTLTVLRSKV
jgi:hypothetical protein